MLSDSEEATTAIRLGEETIYEAAEAAKSKRATRSGTSKAKALAPDAQRANDEAIAEGLHIFELLQALSQHDPSVSRRKTLQSVIKTLRPAFKQSRR